MDNGNQALSVDRQQTRADQVVAMARRHADEIRAAAEEEAERVLREAERESARLQEERLRHAEETRTAAEQEAKRLLLDAEREAVRRQEERLRYADEVRATAEQEAKRLLLEAEREGSRRWEERLEADRRERARFAVSRSQIEDALDATAAGVTRLRELIASLPVIESPQPIAGAEGSVASTSVESTEKASSWRHRAMNTIAIVLGVWAVLMISALLLLSRKPGDAGTQANVATPETAVSAGASSAATRPAEKVATSPAPLAEELGLTIAFEAARDCWISLGVDNGTPSDRLLKASERYVVSARDVVSFKVGNAGAVSVLINDRPAGPLGAEGQVVVRRVTRANYRSFLQS